VRIDGLLTESYVAYLGAQPNKTLTKTTSQSFNGTGSATVFTLNRAVNTEEELEVFVENVQQEPGSGKSYTASGTTLTFDEAPPSGTGNIYVIYRGLAEVTTRLEHDANAALSATTGTFSGDVGIGETVPVTPLTIATTNKLGSTFTGNTNGEGLTVTQTDYTSGNYVSLVEAAYDDSNDANPNVRIGAMFDGGGSNLAFGTSNSYGSGITNTAMFIDSAGDVGIGTTSPQKTVEVFNSADQQIRLRNGAASTQSYDIGREGSTGLLKFYGNQSSFTGYIFDGADGERMRIDSSGNVMVGVTTANAEGGVTIDRDGALNGTSQIRFNRATTTATSFPLSFMNASTSVGHISYTNTATTFSTSSDYRLKENVADMTGAIDRVKALAPKRFNFIVDPDTTVDGFLAHEAQTVVPEAVTGTHNEVDDDGNAVMQGIDQSKLVPLLTAALKESITKIETLEAKVAALEGN